MKNKLLLLAMGFALITQMISAQIPSYVPTSGLVAYYPFNGNANDLSGNGNNGIVTGATLSDDRAQNSNSCYNFNVNNWSWGSGGDEIYIPFNSSFNSPNISVSAWFMKTSNGTQNQGLTILNRFQYGYSNPNGQTWGADLDNGINTSMRTWVIQGSSQNNQQSILVTGSQIQLNTWYNVVFTFDGQLIKQYINGVLISSNSLTGFTLNTNGNSGISIGVSDQANGHWSPFGGKIDDVGLWNRALTQDEVASLYYADNSCQSLVINTGVLSFNPPTYNNTVTIYPNPANDHITIDCGNLANVSGWTIKIVNTLGQEAFSGAMNTQQYVVPLNSWSGQGVYFVKIYDASNNLMNTKKIILQ